MIFDHLRVFKLQRVFLVMAILKFNILASFTLLRFGFISNGSNYSVRAWFFPYVQVVTRDSKFFKFVSFSVLILEHICTPLVSSFWLINLSPKNFPSSFFSLYPPWVTRNRMVPLCLVLNPNYSGASSWSCSALPYSLSFCLQVMFSGLFSPLSSNEIY